MPQKTVTAKHCLFGGTICVLRPYLTKMLIILMSTLFCHYAYIAIMLLFLLCSLFYTYVAKA